MTLKNFNEIANKEQDPKKFHVEEKHFEPPQLTIKPIMKALMMEVKEDAEEDNEEEIGENFKIEQIESS